MIRCCLHLFYFDCKLPGQDSLWCARKYQGIWRLRYPAACVALSTDTANWMHPVLWNMTTRWGSNVTLVLALTWLTFNLSPCTLSNVVFPIYSHLDLLFCEKACIQTFLSVPWWQLGQNNSNYLKPWSKLPHPGTLSFICMFKGRAIKDPDVWI